MIILKNTSRNVGKKNCCVNKKRGKDVEKKEVE